MMNPIDFFDDPDHRNAEELMFKAEKLTGDLAEINYIVAAKLELNVARKIQGHRILRSIFAISSIACFLKGNDKISAETTALEFLNNPEKLSTGGILEIKNLLKKAQS